MGQGAERTLEGSGKVWITWMGTAGCRISDGASAFYIDPFVTRPGLLRVILRRPLLSRTDLVAGWNKKLEGRDGICAQAVIAAHSHFDHAMDAPYFAKLCGAVLIGSESTAQVGRGAGLGEDRLRVVSAGDAVDIGDFRIRFLKGRHGPALFGRIPFPGCIDEPVLPSAPAFRYRLGEMFALLIEHPSGTVIHNGSAGWMGGMFEGVRADAVLQCIAGRRNTVDLFERIARPLGARTFIPIHYDNFFAPFEKSAKPLFGVDLDEFRRTGAGYAKDCSIRWIPLGEPAGLFDKGAA